MRAVFSRLTPSIWSRAFFSRMMMDQTHSAIFVCSAMSGNGILVVELALGAT